MCCKGRYYIGVSYPSASMATGCDDNVIGDINFHLWSRPGECIYIPILLHKPLLSTFTRSALNPNPVKSQNSGDDKDQGTKPAKPRTYKAKGGNALYFNPLGHLQSILGVDLTKVPGIEGNLAVKILSEIGTDMKKWKSEKHFTSWCGLSPENKISGGKRLSSKTKPSANRAALFFKLAAFALFNDKTTALGDF